AAAAQLGRPVMRALAWLAVVALAIAGHLLDSTIVRAACVPALLGALALNAPALRGMALALAAAALVPVALGRGEATRDLAPALIAALIGWLFLRTLRAPRTPLIARMIESIDGPAMLRDPAIARYARQLTALWAAFQFALALLAGALATAAFVAGA